MNRILIIKPGAIGDVLQLTPVVRALKRKFPDAGISLLVGAASTADLFKCNPAVTETVVYDKRGVHRSLSALLALWRVLHKKNFDLVVHFQRSNVKAWFLASAAFPCRLLVYHKSRQRNIHAVVNHLQTLSPLGIGVHDVALELYTGEADRAFAAKIISLLDPAKKTLIALNPGASHKVNRWETGRFAELADAAAQKLSANVVVIGGPDDVPLAEEICAKAASKPLLLAGRTNLLQLGAILEKAGVLVTGDTGPMHIAAAVGTRVVALFGAADPARTGPIGSGHRVVQATAVPCVPCRSRSCCNETYRACMKEITVDAVFTAVAETLSGNSGK